MIIRNNKGQFIKGILSTPKPFKKGDKIRLGAIHTEKAKEKVRQANLGKKYSREINLKKGKKNENHNLWKGGITKNWNNYMKTTRLNQLEVKAGRKKPETCELCGRGGKICFDHNHKTGKFRGWICQKCNAALGFIEDNIQTLELMIKYLNNDK
jgi:hypothetical protein